MQHFYLTQDNYPVNRIIRVLGYLRCVEKTPLQIPLLRKMGAALGDHETYQERAWSYSVAVGN